MQLWGFRIATGLFCLAMIASTVGGWLHPEPQLEALASLGYPGYLMPFLAVAKILGVLAIVTPHRLAVQARLKEWAYAGFVFYFVGAVYSHLAAGDPPSKAVPAAVLLTLILLSVVLRPNAPGGRS